MVGLQTSAPLTRAVMPFGGIRMVHGSLEAYNRQLSPELEEIFRYRKTHNDGVFDVYTPEMRAARKSAIITGTSPMPTAGDASSAITAGCPCTVWTR